MSKSDPTHAGPAAAQNVGYLAFFRRWDTPEQDEATKMFSRLIRQAPDFSSFQALAPRGSRERALFELHFASFEDAAQLIRGRKMNQDLLFDSWYEMPASWNKSRPYIEGLRTESGDADFYKNFEWLAGHATQYWEQREKTPPQWQPLPHAQPTPDDAAIYAALNEIWSTPRDGLAHAFFAELLKRDLSDDGFLAMMQPGSEEYLRFDRILCAYDQAGTLIKNGILHPKLFFDSWQSPAQIWKAAGPWVKALRANRNTSHLYENVDWLVDYEAAWRKS